MVWRTQTILLPIEVTNVEKGVDLCPGDSVTRVQSTVIVGSSVGRLAHLNERTTSIEEEMVSSEEPVMVWRTQTILLVMEVTNVEKGVDLCPGDSVTRVQSTVIVGSSIGRLIHLNERTLPKRRKQRLVYGLLI